MTLPVKAASKPMVKLRDMGSFLLVKLARGHLGFNAGPQDELGTSLAAPLTYLKLYHSKSQA